MPCGWFQAIVSIAWLLAAAASQPLTINETEEVQVYCMKGLAQRGITLLCRNPSSAMHISHASVRGYARMSYSNCTSHVGYHYLKTLTSTLAEECEGKRGHCAFPLETNVDGDINYLEINYECVRDDLIIDWCADTQVQVEQALYLQTNGYTLGMLPPNEMRCECYILSEAEQEFTVDIYVMGLSYEWGRSQECEYDYWSVTIDGGEPEVSCNTQWRTRKDYYTNRMVLELFSDHQNQTDENERYYKGGWLKVTSGSTSFQLTCSSKNTNTFAPPTQLADVFLLPTTTPVTSEMEKSTPAFAKTTTMTSTTSTTTSLSEEITLWEQTTTNFHSKGFIAAIVAGSILMLVVGILLTLLAVAVCTKRSPSRPTAVGGDESFVLGHFTQGEIDAVTITASLQNDCFIRR